MTVRILDCRTQFEEALTAALETLSRPGGVVALPTETVYGLVARADDARAIDRIYELKVRERRKPLAWFVADWRQLAGYGVRLDGWVERLAARHCPGPLTVIAPTMAGGTLGFRVPAHRFVLALLNRLGEPLVNTSANHSGDPNALTLREALAGLCGAPGLAVEGGPIAPGALASTVVDCTVDPPRILRQGALTLPELNPEAPLTPGD